jgi:hypothetical protein
MQCSKSGSTLGPPINDEEEMGLIGKWQKVSSPECAKAYPDEIEFFEARYLGKKGRSGQPFIWWDAGGYRVSASDQVTIQVATDEQVIYRFALSGTRLTFVDSQGCEFAYERLREKPAHQ